MSTSSSVTIEKSQQQPSVSSEALKEKSVVRIAIVGLIGAVAIAVTSSMRGWPFPTLTSEPWFYQLSSSSVPLRWLFVAGFYSGVAALCWSWYKTLMLARNNQLNLKSVALLFAVWAAPLCVAVPLFSGDVFVYGVDGEAMARGFSLYESGVSSLGPEPMVHMVHPLWRDSLTMYGPIFLKMAEGIAWLANGDIVAAVLWMRAVAVVSVVLMAVGVASLARSLQRPVVEAVVFALLNPLTLLHLVSGAHNDATMLGLMMLGLGIGVAAKNWPMKTLAVAICVIGASFKIPAFAAVLILGWIWADSGYLKRMIGAAIWGFIGLLMLQLIGMVIDLGWGWTKATDVPGLAHPLFAPVNSIAYALGGIFGVAYGLNDVTRLLGTLVAVSVSTVLVFKTARGSSNTREVLTAMALSLLVIAWLGPSVYPWYLTWGVALLAAVGARAFDKQLIVMVIATNFFLAPSGHGWLDTWSDWRHTVVAWVLVVGLFAAYFHLKKTFKNSVDQTALPTEVQSNSFHR